MHFASSLRQDAPAILPDWISRRWELNLDQACPSPSFAALFSIVELIGAGQNMPWALPPACNFRKFSGYHVKSCSAPSVSAIGLVRAKQCGLTKIIQEAALISMDSTLR